MSAPRNPGTLLLCGLLLVAGSSLVTYGILRATRPPPQTNANPPPPAPPPDPNGKPSAETYVAPAGHSPELIAFEKSVLYLWSQQEDDGCWSAAKNGAAPEYSGHNADVALTALCSYALLCSSRGKVSDKRTLAGAKKGLDWLVAQTRDDGRIVDDSTAGEPVLAQLFGAMALLQSANMSTRPVVKQKAAAAVRYAVLQMRSPQGGFGATANAPMPRADVTALGIFIYRSALMEEIKFADTANLPANEAARANKDKEKELDAELKKGIAALEIENQKGVYAFTAGEKTPSWDGTVGMLLAHVLYLVPGREMQPTLKYFFGDFDEPTGKFATLTKQLPPGGQDYRALSVWQATQGIVYLFGERSAEWKGWMGVLGPILFEAQQRDGGWLVGGEDAKRGRAWRTALLAMTLVMITPAPPPPTPDGAGNGK